MKRCPITYQHPSAPQRYYSKSGLSKLSRRLETLQPLTINLGKGEPGLETGEMEGCYGKLNLKKQAMERGSVDNRFVLLWDKNKNRQLVENLDLTAKLASAVQLDVQPHGMLWHKSGRLIYWLKRPDFKGRFGRLEYKALLNSDRQDLKSIIEAIHDGCTFPALEKLKLFRLIFFSFITGNDILKSQPLMLLTDKGKTQLAPIVSIRNNDLYAGVGREAFYLAGNRYDLNSPKKLKRFAEQEMGINPKAVRQVLAEMESVYIEWLKILNTCFLSPQNKNHYADAIKKRRQVFFKF